MAAKNFGALPHFAAIARLSKPTVGDGYCQPAGDSVISRKFL
jgi:hypothetical protein